MFHYVRPSLLDRIIVRSSLRVTFYAIAFRWLAGEYLHYASLWELDDPRAMARLLKNCVRKRDGE